MKNIPVIKGGCPRLVFIHKKEWDEMESNAAPFGEWHFEKCERGVKPVKGKFDPNNPCHIDYHSVVLG